MSKAVIYIEGVIGEDTTLKDVIRQFKAYEDPDSVHVKIKSNGGYVEAGEAIYTYLKNIGLPITTEASKAYSIACHIFSVGEERIVEDIDKALLIHFSWNVVKGNADKLEAVAQELREIDDRFKAFYAEKLNIDEDTVGNLLYEESYISGKDAVDLGFATTLKVPQKAVALININNSSKMSTKKGTSLEKLKNAFASFVEDFTKPKALVLQDSSGNEIDFKDLEDGDTPKVGDSAEVDGSAIEDGTYIIPSMDDASVTFEGGSITAIAPKEDDTDDAQANKEPKAEEIKQVSVWEMEVTNTSFEVGDTVQYEYDGNEYNVGAGEFVIPDGRKIITDASGVIVAVKEKSEEVVDTGDTMSDEDAQDFVEKTIGKVVGDLQKKHKAEIDNLKNEINTLKNAKGSKEIDIDPTENSGKSKQSGLAAILKSK